MALVKKPLLKACKCLQNRSWVISSIKLCFSTLGAYVVQIFMLSQVLWRQLVYLLLGTCEKSAKFVFLTGVLKQVSHNIMQQYSLPILERRPNEMLNFDYSILQRPSITASFTLTCSVTRFGEILPISQKC